MKRTIQISVLLLIVLVYACSKEEEQPGEDPSNNYPPYAPTFVDLNDRIPDNNKKHIPRIAEPSDNPATIEGIALGRELFYEKELSGDGTMSCATCHKQENAFTDPRRFSEGIDGSIGTRNAMHINNIGSRRNSFFWDGRAGTMEVQAFDPVNNPIEMKSSWPEVENRLNKIEKYKKMTWAAFGEDYLDSNLMVKAISQFERSLISVDSKFDQMMRGEYQMNPLERLGRDLYNRDKEGEVAGADCFHCHGEITDFTDNNFRNNALDRLPMDPGRMAVTENDSHRGQFKVPSLRNWKYTAPFMHDGRFQTIEEVVNFYSEGLKDSPWADKLMKNIDQGGVRLTDQEKAALIAFLEMFNDEKFITNPDYSDPNIPQ